MLRRPILRPSLLSWKLCHLYSFVATTTVNSFCPDLQSVSQAPTPDKGDNATGEASMQLIAFCWRIIFQTSGGNAVDTVCDSVRFNEKITLSQPSYPSEVRTVGFETYSFRANV